MNDYSSAQTRRTYLTPDEVAWLYGVPLSEVYRAIRLGHLPARRRRNRIVVPLSVIAKLLGDPIARTESPDGP